MTTNDPNATWTAADSAAGAPAGAPGYQPGPTPPPGPAPQSGPAPQAGPPPYPGQSQPAGDHTYSAAQARPTPMQGFFDSIRRLQLYRTSDRWFGGVAAGIAHRIGVAPWIIRLLAVLLVVFAGLSLWVYVVAWILLPNDHDGTIPLQRWIS